MEKSCDLLVRTKQFSLMVVKFYASMPKNDVTYVMGKQILRCGTSVGSNYRAVCKAKSKPDFIAKLGIVEEEADESMFWLELFMESDTINNEMTKELYSEAKEILAMTIASLKTAKKSKER